MDEMTQLAVSSILFKSFSQSAHSTYNPPSTTRSKNQKGSKMIWAQLLAYVTGTDDQELLLRNEYLVAETSGVSSKAAKWGQFKTGQRKWPGTVRCCTRS